MQQQDNSKHTENCQRLSQNISTQRKEDEYLQLLRNRHRYDDGCDEDEYDDDDADCYCE